MTGLSLVLSIVGGHAESRFLYPATLKSVGYYVIPSIQKIAFECMSVRLSVRPSVSASSSLSAGSIFNQFSSNLLRELILGRSVLCSQMGKFWQISTELRPLIYVRTLSLAFLYRFSSNLV